MLRIEWNQTFNRIYKFAEDYNQQFLNSKDSNYTGTNHLVKKDLDPDSEKNQIDDIKKMLRRPHIELMKQLAICLSQQISLEQRLRGPLDYSPENDDLDWLKTNNCALATMLHCSDKTIYRQLSRLEDAGFIEKKSLHGSNADFKLKLKSSIFWLTKNGNPVLIPDMSGSNTDAQKGGNRPETSGNRPGIGGNRPEISTLQSHLPDGDRTKFDHKVKTENFKKNIKELSGEIVNISTISDCLDLFKGNMSSQENPAAFQNESPEKSAPSSLLSDPEQLKKTPPVAAAPPSRSNCSKDVEKYGQLLMNFMFATIFSKMHYTAPSQIEAARQFLIKELAHLEGRELKAKFKELRIRMQLAWDWVQRDPENRYIPNSPAKYLDPDNLHGFSRTKIWYEMIKDNKRKMSEANERVLELQARWDALNKALDTYLVDQNNTSYFRGKRKIQDQHPEVVRAYEQMIMYNNKKFVA